MTALGTSKLRKREEFDFAIDPFEEAVAYETIFALQGITEASLNKEFSGLLDEKRPTRILEIKKQNGQRDEIEELHAKVRSFFVEKYNVASICTQESFHYPESLKGTRHPIKLFYYRGDINFLESPCISVVGSRKATEEGLKRAERITRLLIKKDFTVVSGLAKGIDTRALQVAINEGGRAIAVIGTPIDRYYPKENKELQDKIAKNHLLISQVPFYRYENEHHHSHKFYFPKRNETMAAISKVTIIVEASETSGTFTQAKAALKQGRKLFILDSCFQKYEWPFKLEKEGAVRVKHEEDILGSINNG